MASLKIKKNLKKDFLIFFLIFLFLPQIVFGVEDFGLTGTAKEAGLVKGESKPTLPAVVGTIVGAILALVGVIFLMMIIYGGFLWMTSAQAGEKDKILKAKKIIVNSIIGLIIILAAYSITNFIFETITTATKAQ